MNAWPISKIVDSRQPPVAFEDFPNLFQPAGGFGVAGIQIQQRFMGFAA